jgi:hypothetical protein
MMRLRLVEQLGVREPDQSSVQLEGMAYVNKYTNSTMKVVLF